MRSVMFVVLALAGFGASAQVVYKCVGTDGSIAYQSNRCDVDQRPTAEWSAEPDTPTPTQTRRAQLARQHNVQQAQATRRVRPSSGNAAALVRSGADANACANAKAARDRYYDTHPKISVATMELWGDRVSRACGY